MQLRLVNRMQKRAVQAITNSDYRVHSFILQTRNLRCFPSQYVCDRQFHVSLLKKVSISPIASQSFLLQIAKFTALVPELLRTYLCRTNLKQLTIL